MSDTKSGTEQIIRLDIKNQQQRDDMQKLFIEYSSVADANIKENIVEKLCELPYFIGFIAYLANEPVGFAVCFESFSSYRCKKILNIHDFMIGGKHRGRGYGKVLLAGVEKFCLENDYLKMTLEVDDDNYSAQRLYTSCGFEDHQVVLKGLLHWQKYL